MAQKAVSYFDKSFALTSKLAVSLAFSKKDGPPPSSEYRPWSKHSAGSSRNQKLHDKLQQDTEKQSITKQDDNDSDHCSNEESEQIRKKREEFLSAMGVSVSSNKDKKDAVSKSKFWANDDVVPEESEVNKTTAQNEDDKSADRNDEDSSSSSSESDSDVDENNKTVDKKLSSDLDFLRSKQVKADFLTDDDESSKDSSSSSGSDSDSDDESNDKQQSEHIQSKSKESDEDKPMDDGESKPNRSQSLAPLEDRLFVRNLPFTTTEEELFETFSQFGTVLAVHIPVDDTKRNKGYAFITFQSKHDAKLAMETMDGEDFQGRLIHILPARPSTDQAEGGDSTNANMTYKEKQTLARQKEAEASMKSWSASFMRGDAVVDNISDRLGVAKGDVLNVKDGISSGNAAVRLALGETHIISENIAFFESHGVDISALEGSNVSKGNSDKSKRSTTMILVKNLPYDTSGEDLTKVFHSIGGDVPTRILLPPSKTAALVEYGHTTDARRAFRRLAYKKFKHVPLYLEWAPMMAEAQRVEQFADNVSTNAGGSQATTTNVPSKELIDADDHAVDISNTQSVYVKNLNFSTTEEQLSSAFTKAGFNPRAVKIPTKAAPIKKQNASDGNETLQLSMGFGFVEFASQEEAKKAMKALQGKLVDGHSLEVKLSSKNLSESAPAINKSSKNTKIMVRNVPFEATRSELLKLFGSFGQLKKVRLPKKFDGTHRGFAFCEFLTSKEAQNAMATLSRTHLYGRHLVLEWAAEEENENGKIDVGKAREKAKRDATRAGLGDSKEKMKRKHHVKFD
jgi:multiple RNA-binding domain-containing protein 1